VLLHQAGVIGLPDVRATLGTTGKGWTDLDAIASALADAKPAWEPGTRFGYHAVTYGWLMGELVRRTDGRTLGTFFRDEVAKPLDVETAIGIEEPAFRDLAVTYPEGATTGGPALVRALMRKSKKVARQRDSLLGLAFLGDGTTSVLERAPKLLLDPDWFRAEIPSSNGVTSAHDLARVFTVMALGGEVEGHRLVSEETLDLFAAPALTAPDVVMMSGFGPVARRLLGGRASLTKSLGWAANTVKDGWGPMGPSPRALAAGGLGGHLATADPDARIATGFVRTDYSHSQKSQEKLLKALYSCL
jgi:CubicO group peptidase (beta-lactamase class C family)